MKQVEIKGILWDTENQPGYYTHEEATKLAEVQGKRLPTEEEFRSLPNLHLERKNYISVDGIFNLPTQGYLNRFNEIRCLNEFLYLISVSYPYGKYRIQFTNNNNVVRSLAATNNRYSLRLVQDIPNKKKSWDTLDDAIIANDNTSIEHNQSTNDDTKIDAVFEPAINKITLKMNTYTSYTIPDGYEIDMNATTATTIILKKKSITFEDIHKHFKKNYEYREAHFETFPQEFLVKAMTHSELLMVARYLNTDHTTGEEWNPTKECRGLF